MNLFDPQRLQDTLPGLLGGIVTGLYHFAAIVMAGGVPSRADCLRLAVNMVMAMLAGAIFAYFLTQALTAWIPIAALKDTSAVGFGLGLMSWEVLPFLYMAAKNRAKREADKQTGGQ
jgi:hypothetical protein